MSTFLNLLGEALMLKLIYLIRQTKADLKNDTSKLALKSNLANLKAKIDKIDIDRLKPVPADLSKPTNVVNNDVAEKAAYYKSVAKVNNIDTSSFVSKTKYDTDKSDLENKISDTDKKISDTSRLVKKINYNAKITEMESKIPSINGLATNSALTAIENKYLLMLVI